MFSRTSQADFFQADFLMKWVIACGLFPLLSAALAAGGDWPKYRGPNRDGISPESPVWPADITANEIWRASLGQGYSQVTVSGGKVYTMGWAGNQDTVYCFDEASTGNDPAPIWTESYACGSVAYQGTRATPTVDGNEVYTFSHEGRLSCFDKDTGTPLWNNSTTWGRPGTWNYASSVLVEGDLVIVNASREGVAFNNSNPRSATGHSIAWPASSTGTAGYATAVPFTWNSQRMIAIFGGNRVSGVDPTDGSTLWYYSWTQGMADPIISGDNVWISAGYGKGCVVLQLRSDGNACNTLWTPNFEMMTKINCSVLWNGYVYGIDERLTGELTCVDFSTGSTKEWGQAGFGEQGAVMLVNSGAAQPEDAELVAISSSGDLVVAKAWPNAYTELHRYDDILGGNTWTCPVLANGKLYVRNHGGLLICYDVSGGASGTAVTIGTTPAGRTFTVDAANYSSQQTFSWVPATTHDLSVATTQSGGTGVRYNFTGWSDGPASASRVYTTPVTADSFTADFDTQYQLTTATIGTGTGSVSPSSGAWYDSGTVVSVSATPTAPDVFIEWTGDLSGRTSPQNVTMDGAKSVTARFDPLNYDSDGDGLTNAEELTEGTYMNVWDSDGDGLPDGWEVQNLLDPLSAVGVNGAGGDPDGDGYTNLQEYQAGKDPQDPTSVPTRSSFRGSGCVAGTAGAHPGPVGALMPAALALLALVALLALLAMKIGRAKATAQRA